MNTMALPSHLLPLLVLIAASLTASTNALPAGGPQNVCERITAALGIFEHRYLFLGRRYVSLDANFKQDYQGNSYDLMGVPWPKAAFYWPIDGVDYTFAGKYYFSQWSDYYPVEAELFGGDTHRDFFRDGIDAAGSVNGTTLFFKGCKYVVSLATRPSDPMDLPEGLPCNVDAALTEGKDLYVFKYDKVWKMTPEGMADGMPVDVSSLFSLENINLCQEE